jgi:hypothetical protein
MRAVGDRLKKATSTRKVLWQLLAQCIALCLLVGCEGPEAQYQGYLPRLGYILSEDTPVTRQPTLPELPATDQLHLNIPPSSLDTLDFLALSGCAVQATIGKRNSSLGRMASDSQRLLLALEYLQLAPRCISYQRERDATPLADTLQHAWHLQRQQLPALIFNATLGGAEYRTLWLAQGSAPGESVSGAGSNLIIPALQSINDHARRWLAGDYRADNRTFEILLSEVAAGDSGAPLQTLASLGRRYHALLPPVTALEKLLSSTLPPNYRNWESERTARLVKLLNCRQTTTNNVARHCMPEHGAPEDQ